MQMPLPSNGKLIKVSCKSKDDVMKDHPTPQRSARQILHDFGSTYQVLLKDERLADLEAVQRQLFNATVALLPKPMEAEAYDHEPVKMYERGYNAAVEKMVKKLRIFFNQPEASGK